MQRHTNIHRAIAYNEIVIEITDCCRQKLHDSGESFCLRCTLIITASYVMSAKWLA